ncbi:MAG: threonine synthase [Oscillospiraceae bacterium]|nr:threonine synthase [Oscillospiraceae bacterium]
MKYVSTRGKTEQATEYSSAEVIKRGLAPDGGLFVPTSIPQITPEQLEQLADMTYPERAAAILGMYLTDYTSGELLHAAEEAYGKERFSSVETAGTPAPVRAVGQTEVLELWHGPTSAFKDMALQIMPRLLSLALEKTGETRDALILVATSGDTGKAALEGYADVPRVRIQVFYPVDGVSRIQKKQMATQSGQNVNVTAIRGNFDDAQNGVKQIFSDPEVAKTLDERGIFLSSANSINWGRLVPQIVYYVSAYCDLLRAGRIKQGELLDVTVPTGNFGNIFACCLAKRMGLPIGRMICASNQNNVLTDFINTGVYDRRRTFYQTVSPSMDILISSNLERLLWLIAGPERCAAYMEQLKEKGWYSVEPEVLAAIQQEFSAHFCDEGLTCSTVRTYYETYHYLCDTHTAVALSAAEQYHAKAEFTNRMLVASTASPYKFSPAVLEAIGEEVPTDGFEALRRLQKRTGVAAPERLQALEQEEDRFTEVVSPSEMQQAVLAFGK